MRFWQRRPARASGRLVVQSTPERLLWIVGDDSGRVLRAGSEARGAGPAADLDRRVRELGLPATGGCAVLPAGLARLVTIPTPPVPDPELRAAARWAVKDQVDGRLEDWVLDVMHAGGEAGRRLRQLHVAMARTADVDATVARMAAGGVTLAAVEIAETAQRNLQAALDRAAGHAASALLVRQGEQVLITLTAAGELHDARRLPWEGLMRVAAPAAAMPLVEAGFADLDIVDYGAEPSFGDAEPPAAPRLLTEVQRSLDVWERAWPELSIDGVWVQAGPESDELATALETTLGRRTRVAPVDEVFPGFAQAAPTPSLQQALLPLVGALRREMGP